MYLSDYAVQLLHEDRLRDAEKRRSQLDLIRDAKEQSGLIQQIKQWMRTRNQQQDVRDVRRAPAL